MISSERAPQEEQNDANFSFIAPSSEELSVCKETSSLRTCTCTVKVVMHANVLGNVLMAFLHNRATESHEIWWDCST